MAYLLRAVNVIPTSSTEAYSFVSGARMLDGVAGGPWREKIMYVGIILLLQIFLEKSSHCSGVLRSRKVTETITQPCPQKLSNKFYRVCWKELEKKGTVDVMTLSNWPSLVQIQGMTI